MYYNFIMSQGMKNIFIIGKGAKVSALARRLSIENNKIYVTSSENCTYDFCEGVDIREDDLTSLLKFVLDKEIDMTIVASNLALKSDIVSFFLSNGQKIFGPCRGACNMMLNTITCKKFLYKMRVQNPKFAFFNKLQSAIDYLNQVNFPIMISSSEPSSINGSDRLVVPSVSLAARFLDELFANKSEPEVLIEEYISGKSFLIYFVTDGYSALPIGITGDYKFMNDGDGGLYTSGSGSYVPNYNVSSTILSRIQNIVDNMLNSLAARNNSYTGIIGVEGVISSEDRFYVKDLKPFFQDNDARAILNLVEENMTHLLESCINGFFSDEYSRIKTNNLSSVSVVVFSDKENQKIEGLDRIEDLDNVDFTTPKEKDNYLSVLGPNFSLTRTSATLSRAKAFVYEDICEINFSGMHYRKDFIKN